MQRVGQRDDGLAIGVNVLEPNGYQTIRDELRTLLRADAEPMLFICGAGVSVESGLPDWSEFAGLIARCLTTNDSYMNEALKSAISGSTALRPEILLQSIFRVVGDRVFDAISAIDPHRLRNVGVACAPNLQHYFLAKMIRQGHVVLTTNFDDLIETAYSELNNGEPCPVTATGAEFREAQARLENSELVGLIKLHGTFRFPDGASGSDTVIALLHQVQRTIPSETQELLELLLDSRPTVIVGYSGRDDFDLYQQF